MRIHFIHSICGMRGYSNCISPDIHQRVSKVSRLQRSAAVTPHSAADINWNVNYVPFLRRRASSCEISIHRTVRNSHRRILCARPRRQCQ